MAEVPVEQIVDVTVSLGTQPINKAVYNIGAFLADLTDVAFPDAYRIYASASEVLADGFSESSKTYKFATKAFGGKFPIDKLYVIKYRTTGTVLTPVAALTATLQIDSKPYYIGLDSRVEATVTSMAAYCESVKRMFVIGSQQAGILVPATTTDLASVLQDAAYDHALIMYAPDADAEMSEAGVLGALAAIPAGVSTLEYKTLTGVSVSALNATQRSSCESKNCGYYMPVAGVNSYLNSKVASGQYIDTIIFSDWLSSSLEEAIFGVLKRESDLGRKVAMDSTGFAKIRQACWTPIRVGQANGSVSPDMEPIVRTPTRDEIADADKANRVLPDVVVELLYSGAIHKVLVRAYVTV